VKAIRLASREAIPGVQITIQGPANLNLITQAAGVVCFSKLPPGAYSIRAAHPLLKFDAPVEIQLAAGEVREAIVELYLELKFVLMTYNVFLMSWVWYNSGQMTRAEILPAYLAPPEEAIILNELFWREPREKFLKGMAQRYPCQSSLVDRSVDLENGGVVIVGCSSNGFTDLGHHIYDVSCGEDGLAAKGVKHVRIFKMGYNIHIFGTHTQAMEEAEARPVRTEQFKQIMAFIQRQIAAGHIRRLSDAPGSPLEPIIIGGDLNVDMYGSEFNPMLTTLNAAFPQQVGHKYTADTYQNDLARHFYSGSPAAYYDYLLPCQVGLMPHSAQVTTVLDCRTQEPWRIHEGEPNYDLSDHYPVRGEFVYRI
jgi:hypothetical protein